MSDAGRVLMVLGMVIVVVGLGVWGLGRMGFRGLPGDIVHKSGNVRVYFPIVTCLVISVLLTLALWVFSWLTRR